jgi:predicted amidohydrolase/very-short-patch-repair endonuclease
MTGLKIEKMRYKIMAKFNWVDITKEDVIKAIEKFLADNPEYPEPKSTFLIYGGKKLPAKHIRGMAYAAHYGVEISKSDFGGGMETVKFFERLGFDVEYHGTSIGQHKSKSQKSETEKTVMQIIQEPIVQKPKETIYKKELVDSTDGKIVIPLKSVIEQKNALQLILNKLFNGDIVCEKTYSWLKTPEKIEGEYVPLYKALSEYRGDTAFAKKNVVLRCDFVCESQKLIIEYDERQHFSEARRVALASYQNISLCFDKAKWMKACSDIQAKDNAPKNRDEIRAFYDSTRDIECAKHGYRLVRIMHGQIDFEKDGAADELMKLISDVTPEAKVKTNGSKEKLKVCMYLQCEEFKNKKEFNKAAKIIRKSDIDILVLPEVCYVPNISKIYDTDIAMDEDIEKIDSFCTALSEDLGCAVVVSACNKHGTLYSVFANAFATDDEVQCKFYVKHTATEYSAFDFDNYQALVVGGMLSPFLFKGFKLGLTICYDSNHAIYSRMYELNGGVDLIINSTGGNVIYDKWFKFNKCRAIENHCYELVTMGGDGSKKKPNSYVYGFNPNGGQLKPVNMNGPSDVLNYPGGLYVYEITREEGNAEADLSNRFESHNKNWQFEIPVGDSQSIIEKADKITNQIYRLKSGNENVVFCLIDGMDIMKPEKILPLLYAPELNKYENKRYIIINRHRYIDKKFFQEKLSTVIKVRAMENYCAIVLESDDINKCYQTGKNRTAQVVGATNGFFRIDLGRTKGAETIWKNSLMKATWRKNYEWLIDYATKF